jgi:hypothetical protein
LPYFFVAFLLRPGHFLQWQLFFSFFHLCSLFLSFFQAALFTGRIKDRIKGVGSHTPADGLALAGTNIFSSGTLTNDPNFDFISIINKQSQSDLNENHLSFLDDVDENSPYNPNLFSCNYVNETQLSLELSSADNFSVMSINVQSLPAKFSELKDLLYVLQSNNYLPDLILLQEIWHVADASLFILDSYQPLVYKCRANGRGGGGWASS